ncbi:MAG: DUF1475 family protein [Acidobacteria bacterium]|nr:DUF1475 family protein [Acidobacteriota bacterium]
MRIATAFFYLVVFVAMLWATVTASLDRDVLTAAVEIWSDPWGRATLFDTYFAFLTVWGWINWRERIWAFRLFWLLAILTLGSFAIATYVLWSLAQLPPGSGLDGLFHRKPESAAARRSAL